MIFLESVKELQLCSRSSEFSRLSCPLMQSFKRQSSHCNFYTALFRLSQSSITIWQHLIIITLVILLSVLCYRPAVYDIRYILSDHNLDLEYCTYTTDWPIVCLGSMTKINVHHCIVRVGIFTIFVRRADKTSKRLVNSSLWLGGF